MVKAIDIEVFSEKILNAMSLGVWVVDKDEKFTMFNKGMKKIVGFVKEDTIGTNLMQHLSETPIEDAAHFRDLFLCVKNSLNPER
jgi:PAS domain S-box-containing protein